MRWLIVLLASAAIARAEGERAGDFDYYLLSLSWSPTWCALEGDARNAPQCAPGRDLGWVLHGLWPQYEEGWPSWCWSRARDPSRATTRAMADIMGSPLEVNPGWTAGMVTVTCRDGRIHEMRLCLTKDLAPRPCAPDAAHDCTAGDALLDPVR